MKYACGDMSSFPACDRLCTKHPLERETMINGYRLYTLRTNWQLFPGGRDRKVRGVVSRPCRMSHLLCFIKSKSARWPYVNAWGWAANCHLAAVGAHTQPGVSMSDQRASSEGQLARGGSRWRNRNLTPVSSEPEMLPLPSKQHPGPFALKRNKR